VGFENLSRPWVLTCETEHHRLGVGLGCTNPNAANIIG
jgi:hypothetical protein